MPCFSIYPTPHSTFTLIDLLQNYKEPVRKSQEASQESQQNDAHWIHFLGGMKNVLKRLKLILLCGGMGILPKNIFKVNIVLVHTVMDFKSYFNLQNVLKILENGSKLYNYSC